MDVGIQLPEVERDVRWRELRAIARAAEEAGFASVWLGDHLLYRDDGRPERGPWEAWTSLAAVAAVTDRVTLGPLVACLAFHPPGVLAKMAATVDEVSGGRLTLGVGAGWNAVEFEAFGLPFDKPVTRFERAFGVVRGLIAGERVDGAVLLPEPARRIPLMVGSNGTRMLSITLPHVDAWNTWWHHYGNTPEGFAALNARISEACDRADRDPATLRRSACVLVRVDGGAGERPSGLAVDAADLPGHLRGLAAAGADEAILVSDPITESSVRALGALF